MFPEAEPEYDGESTGEDIVSGSGKMKVRGHGLMAWRAFWLWDMNPFKS